MMSETFRLDSNVLRSEGRVVYAHDITFGYLTNSTTFPVYRGNIITKKPSNHINDGAEYLDL